MVFLRDFWDFDFWAKSLRRAFGPSRTPNLPTRHARRRGAGECGRAQLSGAFPGGVSTFRFRPGMHKKEVSARHSRRILPFAQNGEVGLMWDERLNDTNGKLPMSLLYQVWNLQAPCILSIVYSSVRFVLFLCYCISSYCSFDLLSLRITSFLSQPDQIDHYFTVK